MKKVKELAKYFLSNILEVENILNLEAEENEEVVILKIKVEPESIGRLIGKQGKIIKSLRNLLRIVAYKETGKGLILDVVKDASAG